MPLLLAPAGLLLLLIGWRVYRGVLVVCAVVLGGCLAALPFRGVGVLAMLAAALPVGFLCGLLSLHFERYGVFCIGGVAGALPALNSQVFFRTNHAMYFVALVAFLIIGALTVICWKPAIIFSISAIGAALVERGLLVIADRLRPGLALRIISERPLTLCSLFFVMLLAGVMLQYREDEQDKTARDQPAPDAAQE